MGFKNHELGCFFLLFLSLICSNSAYVPPDNYLIDCGSPTNTTVGLRIFAADPNGPNRLTTVSTPKTIFANTSANSVSSFDSSSLYRTARIFTGPSSYTFPIKAVGRHFVRLYFFPFQYNSFNLSAASFSVSTQDQPLLDNFSPGSTASFKEFSLNLTRNSLVISFNPLGSLSLAFVNAIEVVSVPDTLIDGSLSFQTLNLPESYPSLFDQAFETVYRVNMGGPKVTPDNDTLSRTWVPDMTFLRTETLSTNVRYSGQLLYQPGLATNEDAPDSVYDTCVALVQSNSTGVRANFNVTWHFDVDASSLHFVRLHFCDIVSNSANDLIFNVYIGSSYAENQFEPSKQTAGALATPLYEDFVVGNSDGSGKLLVSIGPYFASDVIPNAILNGLEIVKIMNSTGFVPTVAPSSSKSSVGIILGFVIGTVVLIIVVGVLILVVRRRKRAKKQLPKTWLPFSINGTTTHSAGSGVSNGTTATTGQDGNYGYRFSFVVVQEATNNFDENWVIGVGGFGKVYKGVLRDDTQIAVKRGNPKSQQGLNEFRTEIELLSRLRHRHLVSLIGYCDEGNEMILVYEYMEKGTLKSHLYGSDLPNLSWKQRLEICIGSARGLHYLHTGSAKAIIHRDVKSANILLDENLLAKVADFGLSKTGPELDQTHVSTAVKGSFGYLDPEYFRRQQLTDKSDVYSFGVVLLEVLCARPVIDPTLPREMVNLAEWGMKWLKRGELDQVVDNRIRGVIKPDSLRKFGETVEKCLADYGVERPSMGDVLWNLEYALQLQEADSSVSEVNSINRIVELNSQVQNFGSHENVTVGGGVAAGLGTEDLSDVSMSKVFSQLIKSEGR